MELSERCIALLEKEGWPEIYEWSDEPGTVYEEHAHAGPVVLFVTAGMVQLRIHGKIHELLPGDRFDIPPHTSHSAQVGSEGCQYVVGEVLDDRSPTDGIL
jgi:quercetin dioxygenase-like cupin family protein